MKYSIEHVFGISKHIRKNNDNNHFHKSIIWANKFDVMSLHTLYTSAQIWHTIIN
jgi:hypothetical protein